MSAEAQDREAAKIMYSQSLLEIFDEEVGNNYNLEGIEVTGFKPFDEWKDVTFKVRETKGSSGHASTADNNKGAGQQSNPAQEDM